MKKYWVCLFIVLVGFLFLPGIFLKPALAVKFSLIAPSGTLQRGATVRFTINIDTQGATVKTSQIGMTYETQYLQYVSTTPGNAMTTVSASQLGGGKILFSGENTSGYSGQGVFAYVDLKIIAQVAGETRLCVLWVPTPTPTATIAPTSPSQPTSAPQPTSPPQVTSLPTSGATRKTIVASSLGLGFVIVFAVFYFLDKKIVFKKPKKS